MLDEITSEIVIEALVERVQNLKVALKNQREWQERKEDGKYSKELQNELERLVGENEELKEKYEGVVSTWKDSAHVKYDELKHEFEVLKSAYGLLALEKEELKNKIPLPTPPLDLETPEGYYQSLEAVSFNNKEFNYFVFYCTLQNLFIVSAHMEDYSIGTKYISKADAEAFCEKFNK